eukprot:gene55465-74056_t
MSARLPLPLSLVPERFTAIPPGLRLAPSVRFALREAALQTALKNGAERPACRKRLLGANGPQSLLMLAPWAPVAGGHNLPISLTLEPPMPDTAFDPQTSAAVLTMARQGRTPR